MNDMERALYLSGAHIAFKQVHPEPPLPLKKWRVPVLKHQKQNQRAQRIIGGIARDPVDKTAALVTSKTPKACILQEPEPEE